MRRSGRGRRDGSSLGELYAALRSGGAVPAALGSAIARLLDDPALRAASVAARGRAHAQSRSLGGRRRRHRSTCTGTRSPRPEARRTARREHAARPLEPPRVCSRRWSSATSSCARRARSGARSGWWCSRPCRSSSSPSSSRRCCAPKLPGIDDPLAYGLYVCSGLITWAFFAELVTRGQTLFLDNAHAAQGGALPALAAPVLAAAAIAARELRADRGRVPARAAGATGRWPGASLLGALPLLGVQSLLGIGARHAGRHAQRVLPRRRLRGAGSCSSSGSG